jgi:hypothetical protein
LSPDFHLSYCKEGFSRQKMHWSSDNTLYVQHWKDNEPVLVKLTLSIDAYPKVVEQKHIANIKPILMDLDKTSNQLLCV